VNRLNLFFHGNCDYGAILMYAIFGIFYLDIIFGILLASAAVNNFQISLHTIRVLSGSQTTEDINTSVQFCFNEGEAIEVGYLCRNWNVNGVSQETDPETRSAPGSGDGRHKPGPKSVRSQRSLRGGRNSIWETT
jgi:hypothetical protein